MTAHSFFDELTPLVQAHQDVTMHDIGSVKVFSTDQPEILITSGMHGDESSIVPLLAQHVIQKSTTLRPFVFVPILSPSSFACGTRVNGEGIDLNRAFGEVLYSPEAQAIERVVQTFPPLELLISFHEDNETTDAYLYETTFAPRGEAIREWQARMQSIGVRLFSGIDDPKDELHAFFHQGYHHTVPANKKYLSMFEVWIEHKGYVKRHLTIEVPGKAALEVKDAIIRETLEVFAQ